MYLTVRGLVLRVTDYNDRDAILTLMTHRHGRLTAKVRGLRRKNSPMIAPCQLLAYGEFTLFEYRGMYTVNEASAVELFMELRRDITKLSLGTYFAQVAELLSQEDMPNPELLSLTLNCLYALNSMPVQELLVKAVFELRCANLAGYEPDLSGCCRCGNPFPDRLDITQGHLECASCRSPDSDGLRMPLSPGALEAMRYVSTCGAKQLFAFRVQPETVKQLSRAAEAYLTTQLERGFSALDFYKSLFINGTE